MDRILKEERSYILNLWVVLNSKNGGFLIEKWRFLSEKSMEKAEIGLEKVEK
jgi:hypothetical protein